MIQEPSHPRENILLVDCAGGRPLAPPLALAVLAALTPPEWHVDVWDEHVQGRITPATRFDRSYRLVGLSVLCSAFLLRAKVIAEVLRHRGHFVVAGGPGISAHPEIMGAFDAVFIGEAERIWPRFLADYAAGRPKSVYRQVDPIDMWESPPPCWKPFAPAVSQNYSSGCIQTTRGCPFDCEFCDVVYLFGRRPRHKEIGQVLEELEALHQLRFERILFADDEFIADRQYAKCLMRELRAFQATHQTNIGFSAQATVGIARDSELLQFAADANFEELMIGLETPSTEALISCNKRHNLAPDMVGDIHRILSYGLGVSATFILGFDTDDSGCFEQHLEHYRRCHIPDVAPHPLLAYTGTRLWSRLQAEGRLIDFGKVMERYGMIPMTNIIPARMSRVELLQGWRWLLDRLISWESIVERLDGWLSVLDRLPCWAADAPPPPRNLDSLVAVSGAGGEDRKLVHDLLAKARRRRPYMIPRLVYYLRKHAFRIQYVESMKVYLPAAIEIERKFDLDNVRYDGPLRVPRALSEAIDQLLPPVWERLSETLADGDQLAEALVEAFTAFVSRLGGRCIGVGSDDAAVLLEVADGICAKRNRAARQAPGPVPPPVARAPRRWPPGLGRAVLKGVGDELAMAAARGKQRWRSEHGRPNETVPFP